MGLPRRRSDEWRKSRGDLRASSCRHEIKAIEVRANHNLEVAKALDAKWSKDADSHVRAVGRALVRDAEDDVKAADGLKGLRKVGGRALTAVTAAYTVAETAKTAHKEGWINSIEDHSDDWA